MKRDRLTVITLIILAVVLVLVFVISNKYLVARSSNQLSQVGGIAVGITPKPFLFWLFSAGTPFGLSLTEQNKFAPVTLGHYSTSETEPASVGYGIQWQNYRNAVTQANLLVGNPAPLLGMRVSAVTTSNPVNASLYPWTRQDEVYCNNPHADGRSPEAYDVYLGSIRPDTHSFHRQVDPAVVNPNSFQPRYLTDAPDSWWAPYGVGDSALWPFDFFRGRGWINDATPLYCRPTIKISSPGVRSFVASTTIRLLNAYTGANTASFDNATMYHNDQYNSHPGFGVTGSPYQTASPNQDFIGYLDYVRAALNQNGKKLLINSDIDAYQLFGGHVDAIYTEDDGINPLMTPADIAERLTAYKYLTNHNTKVFVQYRGEIPDTGSSGAGVYLSTFGTNRPDTEFFLAASMLVYENGKYAFSPNFHSTQVAFWQDFYLPTAAIPPGSPPTLNSYQQPASLPNFYYRLLPNATVILNANDHDVGLSASQLNTFGLAGRGFPSRLMAKQGLITIHDCGAINSLDSLFATTCDQYYTTHSEPPPPPAGDANCNRNNTNTDLLGDRDAFYLAATNPAAYASQYGYCGNMTTTLDIDGNGVVTAADYVQWFKSKYQPRRGDANCDGDVTEAGDRSAFLLAFEPTASQYQTQYPQCAVLDLRRYLNDMDNNGLVNSGDLARFNSSVLNYGLVPNPGAKGDADCDGYFGNTDIEPFVQALIDPENYLTSYPACTDTRTADMNCNARIDNFDIGLFVTRLVYGEAAYETERTAQGYSCPAV